VVRLGCSIPDDHARLEVATAHRIVFDHVIAAK
jgi:hypothetical protein